MLEEMAALGFAHVELSHGIPVTLVPGIVRAVHAGVVTITSTHNFCPLPPGALRAAPNLYEPSSPDAAEREQWLRHSRRSLDFAAEVKAEVLVCHLGRVRFRWFDPARKLARSRRETSATTMPGADPAYATVLRQAQARLAGKLPAYWARVQESVAALLPHASARGVRLGFENRDGFVELPRDADFAGWLAGFPPEAPVGYWHDTGHAAIKADYGLLEPRSHLAALAGRTLGFHLHDVNAAGRDHQPVGSGRVDFGALREFWAPGHLLTLELGPQVTADDVRISKARLEALLG